MAAAGLAPGRAILAVEIGAALLLWPAMLNGYPIGFSDTAAFLSQTLDWFAAFDKPVFYGGFLQATHLSLSLWGSAVAQAAMVSHLLWITQRVTQGGASLVAHAGLCAALAALTTAPWVASLLMPDIFAPILVLALYLLGFAWRRLLRWERPWLLALATLAIAVHLSHLVIAAALLLLVLLAVRRLAPVLRVALPLGLALLLLVASNWLVFARAAVSPYGAVFALARLVADGPAATVIRDSCPAAGWHLCGFADRLPGDADAFLWHPDGPLWANADGSRRALGPMALAPEASTIIAATLRRFPLAVAEAAAQNTLRQLWQAGIGDTLGRRDLADGVAERLRRHFPPPEAARLAAGLQAQDLLAAAAAPFRAPHAPVLLLGLGLTLLALWRAARAGDRLRLGLVLCVLAGLLANAFATGALSGPHDRYQARVAWLLVVAGLLAWRPRNRGATQPA